MNYVRFRMPNLVAMITLSLLAVAAAVAQSTPPPPPPPHDMLMMHGPGPGGDMLRGEFGEGKTVKGAPLSGDFVVSRETTLADGNRIHNESQTRVYRDAEGRVRREAQPGGDH